MIKIGAASILSTMLLGLFAWGGAQVVSHGETIAAIKEREKSTKEILLRVDKRVEKNGEKIDKIMESINGIKSIR